MKGKADYLFQRPGSANWWIKLQPPPTVDAAEWRERMGIDTKRLQKSLGTSDKRQAEIIAGPYITQHKAAVLAARVRLEATWQRDFEPGLHAGPDGGRIAATETEVSFYDAAGKLLRTTPNGGMAVGLAGPSFTKLKNPLSAVVRAYTEFDFENLRPASAPPRRNGDDAILETYIKHAGLSGYVEKEARDVWALFKQLTAGKPLKDCDRDDGRKLVAHFESKGLKSKTVQKKLAWPTAAVNLAVAENKLKFNPFAGVAPQKKDSTRRLPLDDGDIATIKRNLKRLDASDQLLIRLLAATGMRLAEAFEIDGEASERGCRYVIVGTKTEQSLRRVPLPACVLPHLPKAIKGRLFKTGDYGDAADAASKRLNRFLDDCGITDPRKVIHSFRHRAQDRLRAGGCPEDIRWAILGHEKATVADSYGTGFPVTLLKKWADKIGF